MERNLRVCLQTKSLGTTTHAPHISHEKAPGDAMKVRRGACLYPPPSIKQHAHLNICCEAACAAGQLNALPSKCLVHGEVTAHEMLMWDLVCVWVLTPGGVVMVGRVEWSEINAQAPVYG